MNSRKWFLLLILLFSFFLSNSFALLATISIAPANENLKEFYSFEKAEYEIIVLNNELFTINDFKLKVSVQEGLQIIDEDGKPRKEKEFIPISMPSGSIHRETIIISGSENADKEYKIFVDYGINEYNYRVETTVKTKKNPVEFNALIEKFSIGDGAKNAVLVDFKNASSGKISGVRIELQPNDSIEIKSTPIELNEMASNESISKRQIEFINLKKISKPLMLEVKAEFRDETGKHELSKKIMAKQEIDKMLLIGIIVFILLALGFWFIFLSKKKEGKHIEHGSGKKHEAIEAHGSHEEKHGGKEEAFPSLEEEKRKLMNEGKKH